MNSGATGGLAVGTDLIRCQFGDVVGIPYFLRLLQVTVVMAYTVVSLMGTGSS